MPGGVVQCTVRGPRPLAEQESDAFCPNVTESVAVGCCVITGEEAMGKESNHTCTIVICMYSLFLPSIRYAGCVVVVFPEGLVTIHTYTLLLSLPITGKMTKVGVVTPPYLSPGGIFVPFPYCHWNVKESAPAAVTLKLAIRPGSTLVRF